eukprot:SAG22_NODE_9340_length_594_cov_1.347475_3_plen_42_part_01
MTVPEAGIRSENDFDVFRAPLECITAASPQPPALVAVPAGSA